MANSKTAIKSTVIRIRCFSIVAHCVTIDPRQGTLTIDYQSPFPSKSITSETKDDSTNGTEEKSESDSFRLGGQKQEGYEPGVDVIE